MELSINSAARTVFHYMGGTGLTRFRYRNAARILMYHRFPRPNDFELQCAHLKQCYRPISMTRLGSWLNGRQELPPHAVTLTVDDGYRDFYREAFPILCAYSIPAIVYLATDMLDHGRCLWVDWVAVLFRSSPRREVTIEVPGWAPVSYALGSAADRDRAYFLTKETLKTVPNPDRIAFLNQLPETLGITDAPPVPEEYAPLTWDEVRAMSGKGIEFGAHTMSHPILSRLASRDAISAELAGSKARIEQELQKSVVHFCYPNGTFADFDHATIEVLKECGYQTAVVGEKGVNYAGADPYQLRRTHAEPTYPHLKFAQRVAGIMQ